MHTTSPPQPNSQRFFVALSLLCLMTTFSCYSHQSQRSENSVVSAPMAPCDLPQRHITTSKLSLHTSFYPTDIAKNTRYSFEFVKQAKPPIIKILGGLSAHDDTFSWAAKIKAVSPCTKVIGRIYISNPEFIDPETGEKKVTLHPANRIFYPPEDRPHMTAEDQAVVWFTEVQETLKKYPEVDYWEGINEPLFASNKATALQEITWYGLYEAKRTQLLETINSRACIANFSMGTPHIDDAGDISNWEAFYPALKQAQQTNSLLCLHEYGYPTMKKYFDEGSHEGWLVGRYRKVMRHMEARHPGLFKGSQPLNIAITEAGIDGGRGKGWKSVLSSCAYLEELMWYDQILKLDANVLGATLFQFEIFPDPAWETFDLIDVLNGLNALHHNINPLNEPDKYCRR